MTVFFPGLYSGSNAISETRENYEGEGEGEVRSSEVSNSLRPRGHGNPLGEAKA